MQTETNIQKLPISLLKPAKYNPRKNLKPGDPAYEKIKRSLNDFGYVDPIIWNEVTGNIVGGHQRYKVLKAEGAQELTCVVVHIENPDDEKALNVVLNKATGEWEPVALADLLSELQLNGYDLDSTGFDAAEVDDLFSNVHNKDVDDDDFDVDAELEKTDPPAVLYHGTAERFVPSILEKGLLPMSRLYVHLSKDIGTALTVGKRHGRPVVFRIDAAGMAKDGAEFFLSVNGVWLTKKVPAKYLTREEKRGEGLRDAENGHSGE